MMEKSSQNKRTENQCLKRKADDDDLSSTYTSSPNKRWKTTNFKEVGESSKFKTEPYQHTFTNRRNTTFANDRLKNLRKKLKTDVISISSAINTDILERPNSSQSLGRNRFEPAVEVSKSLIYNPFNAKNDYFFTSIEKSEETRNVVVPLPSLETPGTTHSEYTICDTIRATRCNNSDLNSYSVKPNESFECTLNSVLTRASASSSTSTRKSPPELKAFQDSANSRLSKLRNKIHKEGDRKEQKQYENSDNNLNPLHVPALISKSSDYKNSFINQTVKEQVNVYQGRHKGKNIDCDYVSKEYPYKDSSISKKCTSTSNSTVISQEINICNRYLSKPGCSPTTSKDKHINLKTNTTSLEKHQNIIQDNWSDNKNYSCIVDSLYKKYFENSEDQMRIFDKSSQTLHVTEVTDSPMDWEDDDDLVTQNSEVEHQKIESKELYLVVDTNVFIHDLNILQEIINESKGDIKPIIYLPWMVISELDFIKDDKKSSTELKNKVQKAVHYINENIFGGKSSIKGQTIHEVDEQKYVGKSPDDKILSCCLFVKEKYHKVIFISNDCLLRNKVLINGIPALSTSELLKLPDPVHSKEPSPTSKKLQEKTQKVLEEISTCCSFIICECAKEAYGRVWNKMSMLSNPPWSLKICLKIFRKYWRSIFQEKLLKQFMQSVDKLDEAHSAFEKENTPENLDELVAAYLGICFYLKDLEEHKAFVEASIQDVRSIAYS